ncbi:MAG: cytochrome P460 family protein [Burkholderiales bacterium]
MPHMTRSLFATIATACVLAVSSASAAEPQVSYPNGYRDWHHVKSMTINAGHPLFDAFGGIHHIYANKAAVTGYQKGRFPDGAVIVFDLLEAKAADNTVQEGARKVVGVMHKDSKKYAATGGWGFEGFKGDSKTERAVGSAADKACFQCHMPQKASDFVFSKMRP